MSNNFVKKCDFLNMEKLTNDLNSKKKFLLNGKNVLVLKFKIMCGRKD